MNNILEDVNYCNVDSEISEASDNSPKKYYIKGEFGRANSVNKNKRIYTRNVYEEAIKVNDENIKQRRMLGELNHPPTPTINLSEVSHVITKLEMKGDVLYGEAEVLDTPKGKILKTLIESGVKLGISTRGYGQVIQKGNGICEVSSNYNLVTADIVADPSSQNAYPNAVLESTIQMNKVKDILEEIFKAE